LISQKQVDKSIVDEQFPDGNKSSARNFCRNPGAMRDEPWCYTKDKKLVDDYCDVPLCIYFGNVHICCYVHMRVWSFCEILSYQWRLGDRLRGLMVRVPGYRFRGPGSIPGATTFSEKYWVWNGTHSAS
jgi:hypothetical protein